MSVKIIQLEDRVTFLNEILCIELTLNNNNNNNNKTYIKKKKCIKPLRREHIKLEYLNIH